LKLQIPIKTFNEWDENEPGFLQIDLVSQERLLKLIFLKEEISKKDEKDEQDFEYII